jgi:hypothetical protein
VATCSATALTAGSHAIGALSTPREPAITT